MNTAILGNFFVMKPPLDDNLQRTVVSSRKARRHATARRSDQLDGTGRHAAARPGANPPSQSIDNPSLNAQRVSALHCNAS